MLMAGQIAGVGNRDYQINVLHVLLIYIYRVDAGFKFGDAVDLYRPLHRDYPLDSGCKAIPRVWGLIISNHGIWCIKVSHSLPVKAAGSFNYGFTYINNIRHRNSIGSFGGNINIPITIK